MKILIVNCLQHSKKYGSKDEYAKRLNIFKKTLAFINEHNSNPDKTRML